MAWSYLASGVHCPQTLRRRHETRSFYCSKSCDKPTAVTAVSMASGITRSPWGKSAAGSRRCFLMRWSVSIGGAEPCGNPNGRQWFSLQGVRKRIVSSASTPSCRRLLKRYATGRKKSGVSPLATALIGFSQGRLCRWRASKRRTGSGFARHRL